MATVFANAVIGGVTCCRGFTVYVRIIRNTKTGKEEVFRSTKPDYVPEGWVRVKELHSFTIGAEESKNTKQKANDDDFIVKTVALLGVVAVVLVILVGFVSIVK